MRRTWRFWRGLAAAGIAVMGGAGAASADVYVEFYQILPNPAATTGVNILAASGWECWLLVATADTVSGTVGGWDFLTPASTPSHPTSNKTGQDWGISTPYSGAIAQRWSTDPDTGDLVQSNYGKAPTLVGSVNNRFLGTLAGSPDSFFFTSSAFAQAAAPSEDNNLANGTNPPYDRNPVPDNPGAGFDTGVGTYMKAAGSLFGAAQVTSQVIAQIWVPAGSYFQANGVVVDGNYGDTFGIYAATPIDVPKPAEPGSLAMLGIGLVMMVSRKRSGGVAGRGKLDMGGR